MKTLPTFRVPLKLQASLLLFLLGFFVFLDGFVSVPPGNVAVIYDRGVGIVSKPYSPGLHLKIPFWQKVSAIMETRLQEYTMSVASREGKMIGDDSILALTKDGQEVKLDVTVQYRILGDNAPYIVQEIGENYENKVIRPGTRNAIRDVATSLNSNELFEYDGRAKAAADIHKILEGYYQNNKIHLEKVLLRNVSFSQKYMDAIEEKQIAQQKIKKAQYEKEEAKIRKERLNIEAEAEAEAIKVKGRALAENPSVIQFEFVQKLSPAIKWGIMPDKIVPLVDIKNMGGE